MAGVKKGAALLLSVVFIQYGLAQRNLCEVPDLGTMAPGEFKPKFSLTHVWQGAAGGVNTKNADRITGLYDFDLYYLLWAEELETQQGDYALVNFSSQMAFGNGLNDKVGSYFEINEAAKGDQDFYIDKLFVESTFFDRLFTLDIGKFELIDFFDANAAANCEKSQFLATPLYTDIAIPFPSKGLGVRGKFQPDEWWYVQAGIMDAHGNKRETGFQTAFHDDPDYVSTLEYGLQPRFFDLPGTYRFIMWYDPQDKSYLDGSGKSMQDDHGYAISFDQDINARTTLFCRYGWADEKVNEVEDFISFGGQVKGLADGRPDDVLGVGYAYGLRSPEGLSSGDDRHIDLMETYYRIAVNKNLYITPSIQLVMDPGGTTNESPATVFGIRCRYMF
ncbi:MAG: carbohydrate porin [Anaerohalosphaeraceae bacterium]